MSHSIHSLHSAVSEEGSGHVRQDNLSCLLYGPGEARFEDRPLPQINDPFDVLIDIAYVGVCGSDVHFWKHGGVTRKVSQEHPLVMGHEASGVIYAIGPAVTTLLPGDRVAIEPGFSCRRCRQCKSGKYNLCPSMKFAADPPHTHGALTRRFRIPEDFAYKIPDTLSLQEAVLLEPLGVAVHGVRLANVRPGESVLVLGSGTIGLLAAATAQAFGATSICVTDISTHKLEFARNFLACTTFAPDLGRAPIENAARLLESTGNDSGFDIVLECTGVEASAQTGLYASAPGGMFIQIGLGKNDQELPLGMMCEKEITLKTAFRYAPGDYDVALSLLAAGKLSVKPLISSIVPFGDATEAWKRTAAGEGIKNLISVSGHD